MTGIRPRPRQKEILEYQRGFMGISAVPGSGKTTTLSLLAANIIASGTLRDDQEVLVVTLVNSAVDIFYQRVGQLVQERNLLPNLGYRVRTLHGLAHDIVRERPGLLGLDSSFNIIDERESAGMRTRVANAWLKSNPGVIEEYLDPTLEDSRLHKVRREDIPKLVEELALSFIRTAKDRRLTPEKLHFELERLEVPLPLAEMGCQMYADYQRSLTYAGGVDFDDLISLALTALESDEGYLLRLRQRWPYILEDEAQDSSHLQEKILSLLVGADGNWVRVGDPNQAIYETFTTANPRYLREFIARPDVQSKELPDSGRSTASLMALANYLVTWTMEQHPIAEVQNALTAPPYIQPVDSDDQNPNPVDQPERLHVLLKLYEPAEEIKNVAHSLQMWLLENQDKTVAVLVPRNRRGFDLGDELKRRGVPYIDSLLKSSASTRSSAGMLQDVLSYLADPGSPRKLAVVYKIWRRAENPDAETKSRNERVCELIRKVPLIEEYLWPSYGHDWLSALQQAGETHELVAELDEFRNLVRRWQSAILLPVDQVVLTLGQDLLSEPTELAITHKLALLLRRTGQVHPSWRLPELTAELKAIAENERRFLGFSQDDSGFDPERYRGKVVVSTIHKAKGLEWDRVYIMSVNDYDFPSAKEYDSFISEKWFLEGKLNLEAEARQQLEMIYSHDEYEWYQKGLATQQARLDYARERLRLLYVAITRAKSELVITTNSGRNGRSQPAIPLVALYNFLQQQLGLEQSE